MPKSKSDTSYQLYILSAIAISFVILGHIRFGYTDLTEIGTFSGWFPYYSFHLPIFLFISGYFYRDLPETPGFFISFGKFFLKKLKNMILPYYIINGIFLLAGSVLVHWGITFCQTFTLERWLLHPWTRPYLITFSVPTWYLISLFIAEIYFVLLRSLICRILQKELAREIVLLVLTLLIGIAVSYINNHGSVSNTGLVYLRSAAMLFFLQVGLFYRRFLEQIDTLPSTVYFLILFAVQFLLILLSGNDLLSPGLYALIDFGDTGYTYFLGGLTGTFLWLRISRLIAAIPGKSRLLVFIGKNTKYIMSFHVFGAFLLNGIFSLLYKTRFGSIFLSTFSIKRYHSYLYYACVDNPRMILIYFLAGLGFSLLLALVISLVRRAFSRSRRPQ
ncbi:MAG: acyltransferase family protein [Parasporobacterium sp.]|nr:acyltransferase family protein [Parasporobacterium sp.]